MTSVAWRLMRTVSLIGSTISGPFLPAPVREMGVSGYSNFHCHWNAVASTVTAGLFRFWPLPTS